MSASKKLPLSPMLIQYLVGLCTLKWNEGASSLNVTLGDLVFDEAAEEPRDVDVTVTLNTPDGAYAFMGYEVKHWGKKLNSHHVEALNAKLQDMPAVTHRAIVTTSGYYKPAIKKAEYHGIDLYVIKEWTTPIEKQFPNLAPLKGPPAQVFRGSQFHLAWPERSIHLYVDAPYFDIASDAPLFDAEHNQHSLYPTFGAFSEAMLVVSTGILWPTKPMQDRLPVKEALDRGEPITIPEDNHRWPFGHTFDVANAGVHVRTPDNALHHVTAVTIQGQLSWEYSPMLYLAMEKIPTGEMFASALVGVNPIPGRMAAIMIPTTGRNLTIRFVQLDRDQLNLIKQLELNQAADTSSS